LAARGSPVAICARSADQLEEAQTELDSAGVATLAHAVDVSDPVAVEDFADKAIRRLGPPWGVVNNAAVLGPVGPLDQVDVSEWLHTVAVNLGGVASVTRAFLPAMKQAGGGRVINLSGGGVGGPAIQTRVSAYTTSKAAIAIFTEVLASELLEARITVNAVAPGPQPTTFVNDILRAGPQVAGPELHKATVMNQERASDLDALFELVEFLLGDEADWLTGKLLSTRWDSVRDLRARRDQLIGSSLFNLRRIDDELFTRVSP
jgi:NAD(P)-dependent dehydrogenase (short-subunit alcohol dehydrogenase family)